MISGAIAITLALRKREEFGLVAKFSRLILRRKANLFLCPKATEIVIRILFTTCRR
jgi:hypothetical protein